MCGRSWCKIKLRLSPSSSHRVSRFALKKVETFSQLPSPRNVARFWERGLITKHKSDFKWNICKNKNQKTEIKISISHHQLEPYLKKFGDGIGVGWRRKSEIRAAPSTTPSFQFLLSHELSTKQRLFSFCHPLEETAASHWAHSPLVPHPARQTALHDASPKMIEPH